MFRRIYIFSFLIFSLWSLSQTTILPFGSNWKYLDDGSDLGSTWTGSSYSDALWSFGNAELGYGDGDEVTVVGFGSNSSAKYITTYFRKTFNISSTSSFLSYSLSVKRDDGVIIYVNGVEVFRDNLPGGTITYTTPATVFCSDDGTSVLSTTLAAGALVNGNNVISAEIHQDAGTSTDISFDLELKAFPYSPPVYLVKGPYLQIGTPNSMTIKWETNNATSSFVKYGTSPSALNFFAGSGSLVTSHDVILGGLLPYTKYYYSVGTTALEIQGDTNNYFITSPLPGTGGQYRFWATGDCGTALPEQLNTKNAYLNFTKNTATNGWLLLGDNAYYSGSNAEYNSNFFAPYMPDILKRTVLWPTPGNHDYSNGSTTSTNVPYFSIFSVPTAAEAGGVSSGTKCYYSYDYGNIHFISMDSFGAINGKKMSDTTGAQISWLKQDLAANSKQWTVAFFHHPPYTMTSHNSDTELDLDSIRQYTLRVLERYKVDLVLCGHSHGYERSKLMKGHFGNEASFNAQNHQIDSSSALYNGSINSCPYVKDSVFKNNGTVYIVAGSSGWTNGGTQTSFPHSAMYYSNPTLCGSLILDFNHNRLDTKWLGADSVLHDNFTILKNVNKVKTFTITAGQNFTLSASWPGKYIWGGRPDTTRSTIIHPLADSTYWVKDIYNCVADTFKIKTIPVGIKEANSSLDFIVSPNPFENTTRAVFELSLPVVNASLIINDVFGKTIQIFDSKPLPEGKSTIDLNLNDYSLPAGIYFLNITLDDVRISRKIIRQN